MRTRYVVAVYDCALACGGPEEGGWWYDTGTLVRVSSVHADEQSAIARCSRLNDRLDSMQERAGRRPYHSVLSDGWLRAMIFEDTAPKGFPSSRPHYE